MSTDDDDEDAVVVGDEDDEKEYDDWIPCLHPAYSWATNTSIDFHSVTQK